MGTPRPSSPALQRLWGATLDFFFPPQCVICNSAGAYVCDSCGRHFEPALPPRCSRCWAPDGAGECARCAVAPAAFRTLRAAFVFETGLRQAVLRLKYEGLTALAEPLVRLADLAALPESLDLVVPVPMTGRRRRRRGANQAEVIAARLAKRLQLPLDTGALRRTRTTPQQAKQPDLWARRENVRGAFGAAPARVSGRRLLVVDDVTTSGATLHACAVALLEAGAASVDAWALARED